MRGCQFTCRTRVARLVLFAAGCLLLSGQPLSADSFDWRNVNSQNWNTVSKNQFNGTCWDFGPSGALEARYKLTRNDSSAADDPDVSEQQNCWETSPDMGSINGGGGFESILNYFATHGDVSESECPYQSSSPDTGISPYWPLASGWQNRVYKSTGYTTVSVANLKSMIKTNGPLVIGFNADDLYSSVADLKANYSAKTNGDNHSVSLEGYVDDASCPTGGYWIIKNSWGTGSGDNGFYYVPYNSSIEGEAHLYAITGPVYYTGALSAGTWTGTGSSGAIWTASSNSKYYNFSGMSGWVNQ